MTACRFLDAMGDVVEEGDFDDHAGALAWPRDGDHDENMRRVPSTSGNDAPDAGPPGQFADEVRDGVGQGGD